MKVSVLIPTRDRLAYLRHAVESVRRQSSPDWEIVIADNASREDVAGYVARLDEPRIVFCRSERPLPVTDNWNAAIDAAGGDFVIMLGDDDALLPGYLEAIARHARDAEVVYGGAYLFAYPGVFDEHPRGFAQRYGYADFLRGADAPRHVDHATAVGLVRDAMRFRLRFGFNMQFATLSRSLIDRLRDHGPVFQSPFPDYYAMCAAFLEARRIVAEPQPLVAIGVTPKSYGFFHANRREDEGIAFLQPSMRAAVPDRLRDRVLPGSEINTGWLLAMHRVGEVYGARHGLTLGVGRYRYLQAMTVYRERCFARTAGPEDLRALARRLRPRERAFFAVVGLAMRAAGAVPEPVRRRLMRPVGKLLGQFPAWDPPKVEGRYATVVELLDALSAAPPPELVAAD